MELRELVEANRSCRRFVENHPVSLATLRELVDLARNCGSAANRQPLKYLLSCDPDTNAHIFPCLAWAGYLTDWPGPVEGERPAAYIVICADTTITDNWWCDDGIAAQTILLGAREKGLAGCIIGSLTRKPLREALGLPDHLKILLALALGRPAEKAVIEPRTDQTGIEYWRDEQGLHHVPKRSLDELILRQWG